MLDRRSFFLASSAAALAQTAPSNQHVAGLIGSGGRGQSRATPNAPVERGFQGALIVQMANLSLQHGKGVRWNAQQRKVEV